MEFFAHRSQEGVASRLGQPLWGNHQASDGRRIVSGLGSGVSGWGCFAPGDTALLKPQLQQGGDQQRIEMNGDPFLGVAEQVQAVQRTFQPASGRRTAG